MTHAQTVSATHAVQMSEVLKQGPRTADELAATTGLQQATVERWLSHIQMVGRVRAGGADGFGPWYRWISATDQQVGELRDLRSTSA